MRQQNIEVHVKSYRGRCLGNKVSIFIANANELKNIPAAAARRNLLLIESFTTIE
jgi:hypothetical protein